MNVYYPHLANTREYTHTITQSHIKPNITTPTHLSINNKGKVQSAQYFILPHVPRHHWASIGRQREGLANSNE